VDALESYLAELSANRHAGAVPETSGYGALANLLNEVGHKLKPKVRCVINSANRGAGIPDGGFFVASQFEKGATEPLPGQLPASRRPSRVSACTSPALCSRIAHLNL
jgi:hypothetical protein